MDQPITSTESTNFDNDFEKVDPPPGTDDISSSTEQDFFGTPAPAPPKPAAVSSEAAAASAPLLDFDPFAAAPVLPAKNPEPVAKPDSTSAVQDLKPSNAPAQSEPANKPPAATTGTLKFIHSNSVPILSCQRCYLLFSFLLSDIFFSVCDHGLAFNFMN